MTLLYRYFRGEDMRRISSVPHGLRLKVRTPPYLTLTQCKYTVYKALKAECALWFTKAVLVICWTVLDVSSMALLPFTNRKPLLPSTLWPKCACMVSAGTEMGKLGSKLTFADIVIY